MIKKRWAAYNHLKVKIRKEIMTSKKIWTRQLAGRNLWKAVHSLIDTKKVNSITNLLSQFQGIDISVNAINRTLSSVFLPASHTTFTFSAANSADWRIRFSPEDFFQLSQKISPNKASPDIPSSLYK